jgi:hypothetical protein
MPTPRDAKRDQQVGRPTRPRREKWTSPAAVGVAYTAAQGVWSVTSAFLHVPQAGMQTGVVVIAVAGIGHSVQTWLDERRKRKEEGDD